MKTLCLVAIVAVFVCQAAADDTYDESHECQLFRQCKDCFTQEFCVKFWWSISRWWVTCPVWAPYCNPYSQRCESQPISECAKLLPTTTSKTTTTVASTTAAATTSVSSTAATTTSVSSTAAATSAATTTAKSSAETTTATSTTIK